MSRKRRPASQHHGNVVELTQALYLNGRAMQEGPKRKNWSRHDLKHIRPLTPAQDEMFHDFFEGNNIFAHGSAGSGKSFIAVYLAMNEMLHPESDFERIIIVRSTVPAREIGFLPGDITEKNAIYEQPYKDIIGDLFGKSSTYEDMKTAGKVEFVSTSFIRGLTWDNAIVIFDEVQNTTAAEINTVMTRVGENTRIIVCGDVKQNDLVYKKNDVSGVAGLLKVCEHLPSFTTVTFTRNDIVRSDFVKQWIIACEDLGI